MNCFKHQEQASIAVCRNCFKGICSQCAIPFDDGVACSERCFEKAKATTMVLENTLLAQKGARIGRYIGPTVISLFGVIYLAWSAYCGSLFGFTGAFGVLFLVAGAVLFLYNRKYFKPIKANDS